MGLFQPKPYKALKDGNWITVTPKPQEFNERKSRGFRGSGSNHPHFDLVLIEKFAK